MSVATMHVHLDRDHYLEITALKGPLPQVRAFGESLIAERGVHHGHLHLVPVSQEISCQHREPHVQAHSSS